MLDAARLDELVARASGARSSDSASATASSRTCGASTADEVRERVAAATASTSRTRPSTPVPRSSRRSTPYHYGTYEDEDEVAPLDAARGRDPRAAARTASARASSSTTAACTPRSRSPTAGYETVMVNCNPETVSTDYDTSDRLFFEPLTGRGRAQRVRRAGRAATVRRRLLTGVIVSLGGQTPLKLAHALEAAGIPRARHEPALDRPRRGPGAVPRALRAARHPAARRRHRRPTVEGAHRSRASIGYPVLVRPSYVLGGRAMQIVYDDDGLDAAMAELAHEREPRTRGRAVRGAPRAHRPLPRGRGRGRRRRAPRPHRRGPDRRRDGAHRGGRCALRRLGVRDPAADARRRGRRHDRAAHARARRRARRPWPAQRAVRGEGRRRLRHRGEPAGQPHRAVREQGDGRAAGRRSRRA